MLKIFLRKNAIIFELLITTIFNKSNSWCFKNYPLMRIIDKIIKATDKKITVSSTETSRDTNEPNTKDKII